MNAERAIDPRASIENLSPSKPVPIKIRERGLPSPLTCPAALRQAPFLVASDSVVRRCGDGNRVHLEAERFSDPGREGPSIPGQVQHTGNASGRWVAFATLRFTHSEVARRRSSA